MTHEQVKEYLREHTSFDPTRIREGLEDHDLITVVSFGPVVAGITEEEDGLEMEVAQLDEEGNAHPYGCLPVTPEGSHTASGLSLPELALKLERLPTEARRNNELESRREDGRLVTVLWSENNRRATFSGEPPPLEFPPEAAPIDVFEGVNRRLLLAESEEGVLMITRRLNEDGVVVQDFSLMSRETAEMIQACLAQFLHLPTP